MIHFENKYFQKIKFEPEQIKKYFDAAKKDLSIAKQSYIAEVIFKFGYDALIKLGIALISKQGYKARSAIGHHVKILEKMAEILRSSEIEVIGNQIRQKRNIDLYEGGFLISEKDSKAYLKFIESVFYKANQLK